MRLLLSTVLLSTAFINQAFADSNSLNYNVVNIQSEASRKVSNDEMIAVLYIEKSNKQPAQLATEINQLMTQAISTAKKYPNVKIETGTQNTYPVYDNDNRKLKEWRGRAEVRLQGTDFRATSQLISELQQNFQTQSINFTVSDTQRKKVESELMIEASKNFQQRAQTLAQAWNKSSYNLITLNLDSNRNYHQDVFVGTAMLKAASAEMVPEQQVSAGESKIVVNANGSIQLK